MLNYERFLTALKILLIYYVNQSFMCPFSVYIDEYVEATIVLKQIKRDGCMLVFDTTCCKCDDRQEVLRGEAVVFLPKVMVNSDVAATFVKSK
jgi:hypothetical protein